MLGAVGRRARLLILMGVFGIASVPATASGQDAPYTFVSIPCFLNRDIGDAREASLWRPGDPNSINASYRRSLDVIFDQFQSESPNAMFSAGDIVEGHWGVDVDNTGIFGPVSTTEQQRRAIGRAANLYYSQWKRRFSERGIPVYNSTGDHEYGDYKYPLPKPGSHRYRFFYTYRRAYVRHFGPRYQASQLTPEVLLVSVDVFKRTERGVEIDLGATQLEWLRNTLANSTADIKIVQGHTPVLGPVNARHSSELMYPGEQQSAFWQTMVQGGVDIYLSGEVHDFTEIQREDGVLQISHGGGFSSGNLQYLVGRIYPDRIDLEVREMYGTADYSSLLWATSAKRTAIRRDYYSNPSVASKWTRSIARPSTPSEPTP